MEENPMSLQSVSATLMRNCRLISVLSILFFPFALSAQLQKAPDTVSRQRDMFSVGVGLQRGFIFVHTESLQHTKGANPQAVELIFSWQRNDAGSWALCNCYPRRGLLLSLYNFDHDVLRKGYSAAYFLEPVYKIGGRFFFSFRAAAGFSYLTRPYDSLTNPLNVAYSTHLNAHMMLGTGVWFRVSDRWYLNASVNYQHDSNGGLRQPNKGINWPAGGMSVNYYLNPRTHYHASRSVQKRGSYSARRLDLAVFGIAKRALNEEGKSNRLPVYGLMLQGSKQVGRISMLTAGVEVWRDHALRAQLKRDSVKASAVKTGVLAGHEFLLGKFLFSQRLGVYVFDQTPYFDRIYHRWGIHYRMNKHVGMGVNLLAHRHVADFIDFRLVYSFQ